MLLDPTARPDTANPVLPPSAPHLDEDASAGRARPAVPPQLASLARRARTDRSADLALAVMLSERGWSVDDVDAVTGRTRSQIEALAGIRRPRTASSDVADRLVARRADRDDVPRPRRGDSLPG